jgi:hypothetical protein
VRPVFLLGCYGCIWLSFVKTSEFRGGGGVHPPRGTPLKWINNKGLKFITEAIRKKYTAKDYLYHLSGGCDVADIEYMCIYTYSPWVDVPQKPGWKQLFFHFHIHRILCHRIQKQQCVLLLSYILHLSKFFWTNSAVYLMESVQNILARPM